MAAMAGIQSLIDDVHRQFGHFATKGNGTEATTKDITRWAKDAGVFNGAKTCTTQNMDIAFSKVKPKTHFAITFDQFLAMLHEIRPQYAKDHGITVDEAEMRLLKLFAFADKQLHGTTGVSKTGKVDHFTDTTQYTGMHKAKFEALADGGPHGSPPKDQQGHTMYEWKWKTTDNPHMPSGPAFVSPGSSGPPHGTDTGGYVHNYKGAGTYDKIHPPPPPAFGGTYHVPHGQRRASQPPETRRDSQGRDRRDSVGSQRRDSLGKNGGGMPTPANQHRRATHDATASHPPQAPIPGGARRMTEPRMDSAGRGGRRATQPF